MKGSRRIVFLSAVSLVFSMACRAQTEGWWHGVERDIHYKPQGKDFVKVTGSRKFNRALYGGNTAFRVEAGDLPEFALYLPGMGGNCKLGIMNGEKSKWITEATEIKTVYHPGSMIYELKDALLGRGTIKIIVLAETQEEGMILKVVTSQVDPKASLLICYGGVTGKKFSRDGDIGADPESSFYLQPAYCKSNRYSIAKNSFQLEYGADAKAKPIGGIFPPDIILKLNDATDQQSPLTLISSGKEPSLPLVAGRLEMKTDKAFYFLIRRSSVTGVVYNDLPALFAKADSSRMAMANRVVVNTPDEYINTLGGALAMAADGIWEDPSYLHGAVAWRMRLPAWRGAYVADPLGWHDRAKKHFSSYALSQVVSPTTGPVVFDTALHLARQLEKMGTSMFSEGYICRNPNGDIRPHHYDMNLVFVDELLNHFNWNGDTAYVREMWPLITRHLAWEKRNFDGDGDGLYDAYACIWASDALQYSGGGVTHSSAYNYRANKAAAELAAIIGEDGSSYRAEAIKIADAIQQQLWMNNKGSYAEYKDAAGARQVHPAAGVWTIYHAIDSKVPDPFQAYQALRYIDVDIPHIPVNAKGLGQPGLQLVATTNWQPYTWSINNVALAENLHTALAYWQGGRSEEACRLWKSSLVESMYLSASPGGFEQLSFYDAVRGELYRDFADPIGMAGRTLVEGLFGVLPDALHDTLLIKPGFPQGWNHASLKVPDISIDFNRKDLTDRYAIRASFRKKLYLQLQVPAKRDGIRSVMVNGKPALWTVIENVGQPLLKLNAPHTGNCNVVITWKGKECEHPTFTDTLTVDENFRIKTALAEILNVNDPQKIFRHVSLSSHLLKATAGGSGGNHSFFVLLKQGSFSWWQPVNIFIAENNAVVNTSSMSEEAGNAVPVDISTYFNSKVSDIFNTAYLSPRPVYPTLQLPTQGIGNWCYPLVKPFIDDSGLRKLAGLKNEFSIPGGPRFRTPSDSTLKNIAFTSWWNNYPDSINIPLSGHASHAYFLVTGTTNHMQSQLLNGLLTVSYTDGTSSVLELKNPETWWPIEQDYMEDGYAFHLKQSPPVRIHLKDGKVYNGFAPEKSYSSIKGFSNRAIDGGAATVLGLPLNKNKQLKSLTLKAIANEVVIGLMGISLLK